MLTLRVFLSSPGDVADERGLARRALARLEAEAPVVDRIRLQEVSWDNPNVPRAFDAHLTPQEAINQQLLTPSECDVVIVILWSRMGTPLPSDIRKPDGSQYLSGTEWEYIDSINASRQSPAHKTWVYRCTKPVTITSGLEDSSDRQTQHQRVQDFFDSFRGSDGSLANSYHEFENPSDFAFAIESHLREYIWQRLSVEQENGVAGAALQTWKHSPYVGLRAFTSNEAQIFYGRGRETDELVNLFNEKGTSFITVTGPSGVGKSSLVWAGLVPRVLIHPISNHKDWELIRLTPGETGNNPLRALALALSKQLQEAGINAKNLTHSFETECADAQSRYIANVWSEYFPDTGLLLFVDQFEELFSEALQEKHRSAFIDLLVALSKHENCKIVATIRADFYERAMAYGHYVDTLRTGGFPLAPPGISALHDMIELPANAAGLQIEKPLLDRLKNEVVVDQGGLALLASLLEQLFERRTESTLTLSSYEAIGGVAGAINTQAEYAVSESLNENHSAQLDSLFDALVQINAKGQPTRRRYLIDNMDQMSQSMIQQLADSRILVIGSDDSQRSVVEIAHESVLLHWKRLADWIHSDENHAFLLWRSRIENHLSLYDGTDADTGVLLKGKILNESKKWAMHPAKTLSSEESELVEDSLKARKNRRLKIGISSAFALVVLSIASVHQYIRYTDFHAKRAPLEPQMALIPAGEYIMGASPGDREASSTEKPSHAVNIKNSFSISKYEITFDEYERFSLATDTLIPSDSGFGRGLRPVINVSFQDAQDYAAWLSAETGNSYRLPTEAEWEYVARAGIQQPRPWQGSTRNACQFANVYDASGERKYRERYDLKYASHNCDDTFVETAPVVSQAALSVVNLFKPNDFGVYHMLGNVWEWVEDCWHDSFESAPTDARPWTTEGHCDERVIRGGGWLDQVAQIRLSSRNHTVADSENSLLGFRLVLENDK